MFLEKRLCFLEVIYLFLKELYWVSDEGFKQLIEWMKKIEKLDSLMISTKNKGFASGIQ